MTSNKKRIRLSEIIGPAFYETHKLIDMGESSAMVFPLSLVWFRQPVCGL